MKIKLHLISAILIAVFLNIGCKKEKEAEGDYVKATINGNSWKSELVIIETTNSVGGVVPTKISGIKGFETINLKIFTPAVGIFPFRVDHVNPAVLLSFTVELFESFHKIKWSTGSEINVSLFTVEVSTDGLNWSTAATKTPAGSNSNYEVVPTTDVAAGDSYYYRLKVTNADSTFSYSSISTMNGNFVGSYRPPSDIERRGYGGTFEILTHDKDKRVMTGRFYYKVKTPSGQLYNINNGEFRVSY